MGTPMGHPSLREPFSALNYRPHFVGLNGHPYEVPIWVPYRAPISRFHFVKLLPLRGRHIACGCPMEVRTYFARFHFVKLLPLRGRHIACGCPMEVRTYFARFHFVMLFSLRAPSGPLMGTLSGTHVGTLSGTHFSKTKIIILAFRAPHVPDHTCMPPPADTTAHSHLICS